MKGATKRTLPEAVRKAVLGEPSDPISDGGIVQDQGKSRNVIFFSYLSRLHYCTYYFLGVICYIYLDNSQLKMVASVDEVDIS